MEPKTGVDLFEHRDFVRAVVRGLLADEHAVDDVVQETCLRALERPPRQAALRAWLARVGRNLALTVRRREKSRDRRERAGARPEGQPSAAEAASRLERHRAVVEAVLALEEPFRSAILLRFYEDLKPREIARELGVPVDTVRSRLRRGLERLRARFDERHGGDRAAWSLALLPLLGARAVAATATGAGTKVLLLKGAIMSAKTKLLAASALLFVAAVATVTWQATAASDRAASPRSKPLPVADLEGARGPEADTPGTADATTTPVEAAIEALPDQGVGPTGVVREVEAKAEEPKPYRLAEETGDALGGLRVIVTDETGNGLPGVKVFVNRNGDLTGLTTGPDGRVEMQPLEAGKLLVAAVRGGRRRTAQVEVVGSRITEVTIALARGATVEGEVRHVERGLLNGVGVALELPKDGEGFEEWFQTDTNEQGRYRLEGVPPGTHALVVWGGVLGQEQRPRAMLVVGDPGLVTKDIVVGRVTLRGTVREADTGKPVPEARIWLHQPPRWNANVMTDARGVYEIMDLPPGEHQVNLLRDGYVALALPLVEIPADGMHTEDFTLRRAATLVLEVLDRDGLPVPGRLTVLLREPTGQNVMFQIDTDSLGIGRHARAVPGTYDVILGLPGYVEKTERVALGPGENRLTLRLEPAENPGRVSLQGTARDATTKEPIANVRVRIHRPFSRETATGPDGVYRFRDVQPGTLALTVSKDGYGVQYFGEVELGTEARTLDLELDPAATLQLHVTDRVGSPVVGRIFLGINGRGEKKTEFGTNLDADAEGHAIYKQIVPGSYVLIVSQGGVGEAKVETVILAGENLVRVRLE